MRTSESIAHLLILRGISQLRVVVSVFVFYRHRNRHVALDERVPLLDRPLEC